MSSGPDETASSTVGVTESESTLLEGSASKKLKAGCDASTSAKTSFPETRIPEIWSAFNRKLDAIEDLEKRLDEHVKRFRRRISGAVDQTPSHRRSHMRLFVTHKHNDDNLRTKWTLVVEGKLLIGLLDHVNAQKVDKHGAFAKVKREDEDDSFRSASILPTVPPASSSDEAAASSSRSNDRNRYRSVGDVEEDPVEPTLFTHVFSKMIVSFRTVWQPETPPQSAPSLTPPKKSRKRKTETVQAPATVNPKHLRASKTTNITWTKKQSGDAHAFRVNYDAVEAPPSMKFHSVVAKIFLFPTTPATERRYRPSPSLVKAFFPKHGLSTTASLAVLEDGSGEEVGAIPLENDIRVPSPLTLNEVLLAFYQYITDKKLQDETDKSLILCDKTLTDLLGCDSLSFGDLQSTIFSRQLLTSLNLGDEPVVLSYVMNQETASPQEPPPPGTIVEIPEGHHHQVLSFDMEVSVPSFFHWRAREIMRRIKRREFEYTSSRTKARYMLVASRGNEDIIKTKIGECISGHGYAEENIPIFLALAKAAPPGSEAKGAAQADAKTCALVGRLDECTRQAQVSWDLVNACKIIASPHTK